MQWVRPEIKLTGGISNGGKGTDLKQWFLNYDHRSSKFFHGIHEIKTIFIIVLRCYLLLKFLFSHECSMEFSRDIFNHSRLNAEADMKIYEKILLS